MLRKLEAIDTHETAPPDEMLDTLPERLTLVKQNKLGHAAFLELVLADEIDRGSTIGTGGHEPLRGRPGPYQ